MDEAQEKTQSVMAVADVLQGKYEYAGFWIRSMAATIDGVIMFVLTAPMLIMAYGSGYIGDDIIVHGPLEFFLSWILPFVGSVWFWMKKGATPGKMACSLQVVDAKTGNLVSVKTGIVRYVGYFVSAIVLGIGYLMIAFDSKKQGLHDKMAGTVVVRKTKEPVSFQED